MTDKEKEIEKVYEMWVEHCLTELFEDKDKKVLTIEDVDYIMNIDECLFCQEEENVEDIKEYKQLTIEDLGINLYEEE